MSCSQVEPPRSPSSWDSARGCARGARPGRSRDVRLPRRRAQGQRPRARDGPLTAQRSSAPTRCRAGRARSAARRRPPPHSCATRPRTPGRTAGSTTTAAGRSVPLVARADDGVFFDTLTLKALVGSFSLEGGADGAVLPAPPCRHPERLDPRDRGGHPRLRRRRARAPAAAATPRRSRCTASTTSDGASRALDALRAQQRPVLRPVPQAARQPDERPVRLGHQGTGHEDPHRPHSTDIPITVDYETGRLGRLAPGELGWCPNPTSGPTAGSAATRGPGCGPARPGRPAGKQFACVISRTVEARSPARRPLRPGSDLVYVLGDATMRR